MQKEKINEIKYYIQQLLFPTPALSGSGSWVCLNFRIINKGTPRDLAMITINNSDVNICF